MFNIRHRKMLVIVVAGALLLTTIPGTSMARDAGDRIEAVAADVVLQWNAAMLDLIKRKNISNLFGNRTMAMLHIAMFDSINGIQSKYSPYLNGINKPPQSISPYVAAATAAYTILSRLYPSEQVVFESLYHSQLSGQQSTPDLSRFAVQYGERIALAVLELRENDGSAEAASAPYPDGTEVGKWRRTPPFMPPMLPGWGLVKPFAMTRGDQFRLMKPPPLDSYEYARDFNEVKTMGAMTSIVRTPEQTQIARFWPAGIPRMWNLVAREVAQQNQYELIENARLFALLNITLADANVMAWDMKYRYGFWRPITAIEFAAADGNDGTASDPGWGSLIPAPAFPEYVSGHSTACASAAMVLAKFTGSDSFHFELTSEANPGLPPRTFNSFWEAASEAGISRIYGGIHFNFSNVQGLEAGRSLGRYIFENFMIPLAKG